MLIFLLMVLGILGLVIGSFLGVVISRLPQKKSIIYGHSYCDHCHKSLQWFDLIPLISYFSLNGKCRYCHFPIGKETVVIEIITAVLFLLTGITVISQTIDFMNTTAMLLLALQLLYYLYIVSSLIIVGFIDLKHGIIPNAVVYPAIGISLFYFSFFPHSILFNHILAGIGAMVFFFLLFLCTKGRGMGFGDVKFTFLLGLFLGFPNIIVGLYVAFLTGALIALILIIEKKKKFYGSTIPFGPFLVLGGLISFFWSNTIIEILLKILT